MQGIGQIMMAILAILVGAMPCVAGEEPGDGVSQDPEEIRVIDVVIVSTNRVTVGTNTMSLAAANNFVVGHRGTVDVVAVHGSFAGEGTEPMMSATLAEIARAGVPLVIVEKNGEYTWKEQSASAGIRTVKVGTDQFAMLRRFWKKGDNNTAASTVPVLQASGDWDMATGTYELRRVELGLFGEHVWLMHQQRESDAESGTVGFQIKKSW